MHSATQIRMAPYRNRSGASGIDAYALLDEGILVRFADGATYRYGLERPGRHHIGRMKSLALGGRGLAAYINRYVREKYEARCE